MRGKEVGGQVGRVDRLVRRDAGGLEQLADALLGACAVRRRRGGFVGLADLEQQRVDVDRLAVHRRPDEQRLGARRDAQRREQVVEQDVVGGERRDLGERAVELAVGLQERAGRVGAELS